MLARITLLNPANITDTHCKIIAVHVTKNHQDASFGATLYYKGVSLKNIQLHLLSDCSKWMAHKWP